MPDIHFEKCLKDCIDQNVQINSKLQELRDEMNSHHQTCNGVKTAGTTVSATGTGILVASVVAAPFTGGLSLVGSVGGLAMSLGGGATNLITDYVDSYKTKDSVQQIQDLVNSKEDLNNSLQKHFDAIQDIKQQLIKDDISHDEALFSILTGIANGSVDHIDVEPGSTTLRLFTTLARLSRAEDILLNTSKMGIKGLEIGFPGLQRILSTLGFTANIGTNAVKTLGRVSAVFSVAMTVVDIALLIRDWNSYHPTIKVIDEVIDKMSEENRNLNEIHSLMDALKERVCYTTIDGIPIVGATHILNQIIVHLINNQGYKCPDLLIHNYGMEYSFKDLQTPEKIAILLSKDTGAAVGFDTEQVEYIIKKPGKSAGQEIRDLAKNLLKNLKQYEKTGIDSKRRSLRGGHVINNKVILVYREIIETFVQRTYSCSFTELTRIPTESVVHNDFHNPLPHPIRNNIEDVIPSEVWYINSNAVIYDFIIDTLRESAKLHMASLYNTDDTENTVTDHSTKIRTTVYLFNQLRVYVDELALQYWITHKGGSRVTFDESSAAVQTMLQNLYEKMGIWVSEIKQYYPNRLYPEL